MFIDVGNRDGAARGSRTLSIGATDQCATVTLVLPMTLIEIENMDRLFAKGLELGKLLVFSMKTISAVHASCLIKCKCFHDNLLVV